jgi:hypothetical protein
MTRTAVRHALCALATLALVSAFAIGPASAERGIQNHTVNGDIKINTPKGHATQRRLRSSTAKPLPSTGLTSYLGFSRGMF